MREGGEKDRHPFFHNAHSGNMFWTISQSDHTSEVTFPYSGLKCYHVQNRDSTKPARVSEHRLENPQLQHISDDFATPLHEGNTPLSSLRSHFSSMYHSHTLVHRRPRECAAGVSSHCPQLCELAGRSAISGQSEYAHCKYRGPQIAIGTKD
jgi:hypothetical protein